MINKFYKRINNKYSNIFKFFLYLRFVFAIFLVSTSLFFLIPKLFDYEKRKETIKQHLLSSYGLEVKNLDRIKFKIFPTPNLVLHNLNYKIKSKPIILKSDSIKIFLNIKNIYNFENLKIKKIQLNNSKISLNITDSKKLINYLKRLKYKLDINALTIDLKRNNLSLIKISNIKFSNYGYKKYNFKGKVFGKKFKAIFKDSNQSLNFNIFKTGLSAKIKFDKKNSLNSINGYVKIKLLNNFLKFYFSLNDDNLKITKSNFRGKDYSFSLDSLIKYNPFFSTETVININFINKDVVSEINLQQMFENKKIIKKFNSTINLNYKNKKYFTNLIEDFSSNISLTHGRLIFSNNSKIIGAEISCSGDSNLTEVYPRLNFKCNFDLQDKKKLFKKLSVSKKISNRDFSNLHVEGTLNLLKNKISLKKLSTDKDFIANKEDLKFFEDKFDSLLFNEGVFNIFKLVKIKEFLLNIT